MPSTTNKPTADEQAWVAETGLLPSESVLVEQTVTSGEVRTLRIHVEKRDLSQEFIDAAKAAITVGNAGVLIVPGPDGCTCLHKAPGHPREGCPHEEPCPWSAGRRP